MTQNTNEPLHIVGTDLLDYSFKVEQAIKQGYTFSDLNMYAPRAWPHMFEAWMVKENTTVESSESPSIVSDSTSEGVGSQEGNKAAVGASKPVAKRGRK